MKQRNTGINSTLFDVDLEIVILENLEQVK